MTTQTSPDTTVIRTARQKALVAGGIGNFVEWFDFGLYAQFAVIIGTQFFPSDNPTASLLASFSAFAVGFLARPIGGIVFGHFGDRMGRRVVLSAAVLLMSGSTVAIALTPNYATIGIVAPILLVLWRVLQGASAGGEYAGSSSFVIEYAPPRRRALFGSVNPVSVGLGTATGAVVGLIVTQSMDAAALEAWGWRIPFLVAGPIGLIGLYLRLKIQETPEFEAVKEAAKAAAHPPIVRTFTLGRRPLIVLFLWSVLNAVGFYLLSGYMITYSTEELGLSRPEALLAYIGALVVFAIACPLAGMLADRWGRKRVAVISALFLGIAAVPSFLLMGIGGFGTALLGQSVYAIGIAAVSLITPMLMVELFDAEIRYTASALAYNLAYAILGGTAPLVATWLISASGAAIAPGYYVVLVAIVGLLVAWFALGRYYDRSGTQSHQMVDAAETTAMKTAASA